MRRLFVVVALCLLATSSARAQLRDLSLEIRPFAGATIPLGDQRDVFNDAFLLGLQGAVEVRPNLNIVGTFGWSPATSRYDVADDGANIFLYDVGVELGLTRELGGWRLQPFVGGGIGGRTYVFSSDDLGNGMCFSGYGALGTELQLGRTSLRVEGRGNVFCYKSPFEDDASETRADIGLTAGLAYRFR